MTDYGTYPPNYGHEWRGDWLARLLDILRLKGFSSLTAFARTMPSATLDELVAALGEGDVAPVQLQWRLIEEARLSNSTRECALSLFVRFLRRVSQGWPSDLSWNGQRKVRIALISWQTSLEEEHYKSMVQKMVFELLKATDIPPGWLPEGEDDPRVVSLFERHWPQEEGSP